MREPSDTLAEAVESAERALAGAEQTASLRAHHLRALLEAVRDWPFNDEDLGWIDHRIRELEQKTEACAVGAPMRAAFEEEIAYWKDLRGRTARRIPAGSRA